MFFLGSKDHIYIQEPPENLKHGARTLPAHDRFEWSLSEDEGPEIELLIIESWFLKINNMKTIENKQLVIHIITNHPKTTSSQFSFAFF